MRALTIAAALVFVLDFAGPAHAAASDATRQEFLDALSAARRGDLADKSAEVADLRGYPLYDYLQATQLRAELRTNAGAALDARIERFIEAHLDLPPAQQLRDAWIANLADRGQWQQVIDRTRASDGTSARCRAVHGKIELGRTPVKQAIDLYIVGRSQPSACDPVFAWLDDTGRLTATVIRKRAHKAILNDQYGLARYLTRQMPIADTAIIDRWLNVAETPSNLADARAGLDPEIAVYAFKRLALRDLDTAAGLIKPLVARLGLNGDQRYQMRRYVALLYAEDHRPEALLWFARIDHARMVGDEHALGWEIRAAIYQQRWPLVLDAINSLSAATADDEVWRYWKARALAATGQKPQARAIFARLASRRSYHGYLAADAIGADYSFNAQPVPDNPAARARVEAEPALARAHELHELGMTSYAYLEWQNLIAHLNSAELAQAAKIAYQWQWYARAIVTLAKADYWNDLDIRYPTPFVGAVREAADNNDLDPAYVMAIIRTESLFQPTARSPAGARGLMQLMPGTAADLARAMGRPAPSAYDLNDPATNIGLGARYLGDMLAEWSGNIALATASYNAGPHKIAEWLPDHDMPAAIWIANIPYTETRRYVRRAMSHMTVFQHRLAESVVPLDQRIDEVKPSYPDDSQTTF
ncbi:transglycosylase SLT domain-containing protein [Salinisphaera sp.]|uniref:transglycosylase SLT domain-containing protein n=1 Tax=Salinisphaera sp. TaxID=1914330 RepID=UPI002D774FF5|nr:transglycosylase SLT domain-containing protein [Salinisphaera sp.]HET7314565.1 transglycosylase SLT domain-containing protein [Salinisphaera sp.]